MKKSKSGACQVSQIETTVQHCILTVEVCPGYPRKRGRFPGKIETLFTVSRIVRMGLVIFVPAPTVGDAVGFLINCLRHRRQVIPSHCNEADTDMGRMGDDILVARRHHSSFCHLNGIMASRWEPRKGAPMRTGCWPFPFFDALSNKPDLPTLGTPCRHD